MQIDSHPEKLTTKPRLGTKDPEEAIIKHMTRWVSKSGPAASRLDLISHPIWPRLPIKAFKLIHSVVCEGDGTPKVQRCRLRDCVE